MCAEAQVDLGLKRRLYISLLVGSFGKGVKTGSASFWYAVILEPDGSRNWVKSLSRLGDAIKAVR